MSKRIRYEAGLDEDDIPDELRNIQDTYEVLKNNKKLKEMESD